MHAAKEYSKIMQKWKIDSEIKSTTKRNCHDNVYKSILFKLQARHYFI